jgi:hypothetical protein
MIYHILTPSFPHKTLGCGIANGRGMFQMSQRLKVVLGAAALAAVVSMSLTAAARANTVYDWTISGGSGGLSGSGTITLSSMPTMTLSGTGYAVTAIGGTLGSDDFTTSTVTGPWVTGQVDNIVYYPTALADGHILDDFGLGIVLGNGYDLTIGAANGNAGLYNANCCGSNNPIYSYPLVSFDLGPVSATPLPPAWTMLIAGFIGLGFFAYRGSKKNAASFAVG